MAIRRRIGFTLIELLVVIAIIAILAAMLFPVFARARESARKIQCLSNVKNIAMAIQMYVGDWGDRFWPRETRQEVREFWESKNANGYEGYCWIWDYADGGNPYLMPPVLLDEYVRNRDVWRCPSSSYESGPGFIYGSPDWFREIRDNEGTWYTGTPFSKPCPRYSPYPNGWGGAITDSIVQGRQAYTEGDAASNAQGMFLQSIAVLRVDLKDVKLNQFSDPAKTILGGDGNSAAVEGHGNPLYYAFGNACGAPCADTCSCYCWSMGLDYGVLSNSPQDWKRYATHLGGSNLMFADGHAQWFPAFSVLNGIFHDEMTLAGESGICWFGSSTCGCYWGGWPPQRNWW